MLGEIILNMWHRVEAANKYSSLLSDSPGKLFMFIDEHPILIYLEHPTDATPIRLYGKKNRLITSTGRVMGISHTSDVRS